MQDQCIREMMQWEESALQAISLIIYACACRLASPSPQSLSHLFLRGLGLFCQGLTLYHLVRYTWKGECDKNTAVNSSGSPGGGNEEVDDVMDEKVFKWLVSHMVNPRQTIKHQDGCNKAFCCLYDAAERGSRSTLSSFFCCRGNVQTDYLQQINNIFKSIHITVDNTFHLIFTFWSWRSLTITMLALYQKAQSKANFP